MRSGRFYSVVNGCPSTIDLSNRIAHLLTRTFHDISNLGKIMNYGGTLLQILREKQGNSLELVSGLAGVGAATWMRLEKGQTKLPSDHKIIELAAALNENPAPLIDAFAQDRIARGLAKIPSRQFIDDIQLQNLRLDREALVQQLETQRMNGQPEIAAIQAMEFKAHWEPTVQEENLMSDVELKRLLMQASLTRAYALTLTNDTPHVVRFVRQDRSLTCYRGYLSADDHKYRDMALLLPGLLEYLLGNYGEALTFLSVVLERISDPYVHSLGVRDLIVSSSKIGKLGQQFGRAASKARDILQNEELDLIDRARVSEGLALGGLRSGLGTPEADLHNAIEFSRNAEQQGFFRPSVESQIARTEILLSLSKFRDADCIINAATSGIRLFRKNGCYRYVAQIKKYLLNTASKELQKFAATI